MITNRLEGRCVYHFESQELYRENGAAINGVYNTTHRMCQDYMAVVCYI